MKKTTETTITVKTTETTESTNKDTNVSSDFAAKTQVDKSKPVMKHKQDTNTDAKDITKAQTIPVTPKAEAKTNTDVKDITKDQIKSTTPKEEAKTNPRTEENSIPK